MAVFKCNKCGNTIDVVRHPKSALPVSKSASLLTSVATFPNVEVPDSGNINPQVFQESYKSDKK